VVDLQCFAVVPALARPRAEAIKRWRPWKESTGPRTAKVKARVSRDAYEGGTLLRELGRLLRQGPRE